MPALSPVTLIGFPFGSTGRSEHIRAVWRALAAAGVAARIFDVGATGSVDDADLLREFGAFRTQTIPPGIRLFHLNGDEVARHLPALLRDHQAGAAPSGHNIVFPAWELPHYPAQWARSLEQCDEVWAASTFAYDSIRAAVKVPVLHMPNACEPHVGALLGRAHFGVPQDRLAILFFFDFWSYPSRKNPRAVIETFRRLLAMRADANVQLVLKLNHSSHDPAVLAEIGAATAQFGDRVSVIDATLTNNEAKNLVRCCDVFLSLHRSEGFGRGPAEAMFFGKPVIATGWSGNMEYMNDSNACLVRYSLIPVGPDEYPFAAGQVWADPDIAHATEFLVRLVDEPAYAKAIGERARQHMMENFSDSVLGARYRARFEAIAAAAA